MQPVICQSVLRFLLIFVSIQPLVGGLAFAEAPMAGGSVRGTVVDSVTGAAVARARVGLLVATGQTHPIETTTTADGRFEFLQVPTGECRLYVNKFGYLNWMSRRRASSLRGGTETQIQVTPDQPQLVHVALTPAAVVVGRVLAPDGEPVENVRVTLMRAGRAAGQAGFALTGMTNDAGEFRIPRVEPGSYLLMSTPPGRDADEGVVVPTYYPGTASASEATRVEVAKGATVSGLDFMMQTVKTGTITGVVLDTRGQPLRGGEVRVSSLVRGHEDVAISMPSLASTHTGADGRFQLHLPAGEYWLKVSQGGRGVGSISIDDGTIGRVPTPEDLKKMQALVLQATRERAGFASARVSVAAEATTDVALQVERPVMITGRFIFEGRTSPSGMSAFLGAALARFMLAGGPGGETAETQAAPMDPTTNAADPDLAFELLAAPGTYVASAIAGPGWAVKAVQFGSEDVTNRTITLEPGRTVENARIIFTDRPNSVSLRVLDAGGSPTTDYVAFVFPVDESLWTTRSLLRLHIPGQHVIDRRVPAIGIELGPIADYSAPIGGLTPGNYYAVALDDASWDDFNDPGVLQRLAEHALKFQIGDGETRQLDLRRTTLLP